MNDYKKERLVDIAARHGFVVGTNYERQQKGGECAACLRLYSNTWPAFVIEWKGITVYSKTGLRVTSLFALDPTITQAAVWENLTPAQVLDLSKSAAAVISLIGELRVKDPDMHFYSLSDWKEMQDRKRYL